MAGPVSVGAGLVEADDPGLADAVLESKVLVTGEGSRERVAVLGEQRCDRAAHRSSPLARKGRTSSAYKKIRETSPATVVTAVFALEDTEQAAVRQEFGPDCLTDTTVTVKAGYYGSKTFAAEVDIAAALKHLTAGLEVPSAELKAIKEATTVAALKTALQAVAEPTAAVTALLSRIDDDAVIGAHQRGAFHRLATHADRVPDELRARLGTIAVAVAQRPPHEGRFPFGNEDDARGAAANLSAAIGALNSDQAAGRLLDLLAGDADQRQLAAWIARRLGRAEDTGVLVTLTHDAEPAVRATAAGALASLVEEDRCRLWGRQSGGHLLRYRRSCERAPRRGLAGG